MYQADSRPESDLEPLATHQEDTHPASDAPPQYDGSMYLVGYLVAAAFGAVIGLALGATL